MNTPQRYEDFKDLPVGAERREAVRAYLGARKGITSQIAARANVDRTVVSKILHGRGVSAPVEEAIKAEENVVPA